MRIGCVLNAFVWMLITWARLAWHYTVDFTQWLEAPPPQCTCCPIRCRGCQEVGWGRWFLFCCCERELKWKMTSKLSFLFLLKVSVKTAVSAHWLRESVCLACNVVYKLSTFETKGKPLFLVHFEFQIMYVLSKYYCVWIKCILFELFYICKFVRFLS